MKITLGEIRSMITEIFGSATSDQASIEIEIPATISQKSDAQEITASAMKLGLNVSHLGRFVYLVKGDEDKVLSFLGEFMNADRAEQTLKKFQRIRFDPKRH